MASLAKASARLLANRVFLRVAGLSVGAVFVYASLDKIVYPDRFADILNDYDMLPPVLINPLALIMPWLELVTGLALIIGVWRRAAGLLATVLTVAFLVSIAQAQLRGLEVECGCFDVSGSSATTASWSLFLRDVPLLAASALLWRCR